MINRIRTWWREWQSRRDARLIAQMQATVGETRRLLNLRTGEFHSGGIVGAVDPARPGGGSTTTIRIWNGPRPATTPEEPVIRLPNLTFSRQIYTIPSRFLEGNVSLNAVRDGDDIRVERTGFDLVAAGIRTELAFSIPAPLDLMPDDTFVVSHANRCIRQQRIIRAGMPGPGWNTDPQLTALEVMNRETQNLGRAFADMGSAAMFSELTLRQLRDAFQLPEHLLRPPPSMRDYLDLLNSEKPKLAPRHPDTGKVLKSRKVQRSVLGVDVENTRGALGSVERQTPKMNENERIAIKFKRRLK